MQILFLDIDGVLNHTETRHKVNDVNLDRECIANLNRILDHAPHTIVVLCSAWRTQETLLQNQRDLLRHGFRYRLHTETPVLRNIPLLEAQFTRFKRNQVLGELDFPVAREFEIYGLLDQQLIKDNLTMDGETNLCIVDDMALEVGMTPRFPSYYGTFFAKHAVKTKERDGGLTRERADRCIELLTGNVFYDHTEQRNRLYDFYKQEDEKDNAIDPTYRRGDGTFECLEENARQNAKLLLRNLI